MLQIKLQKDKIEDNASHCCITWEQKNTSSTWDFQKKKVQFRIPPTIMGLFQDFVKENKTTNEIAVRSS